MTKALSRHGTEVTYTPSEGNGKSIHVFYQRNAMESEISEAGFRGAEISVVVDLADVESPVVNRDSITIGSDTYTVRDVQRGTRHHVLICTRDEHRVLPL